MSPDKKSYLVWALAGLAGVIFIATIIFLISFVKNINPNSNSPVPVPKAEEFVPPQSKISPYATDSGILKLRSDLQKLRSDIDSVDIFEPQLSSPNIDLNISIKPQ